MHAPGTSTGQSREFTRRHRDHRTRILPADENGDFVIPNGGNTDVTVQSPVRGRWFRVFNEGGADTVLSQTVTPPGPADFIHNAATTSTCEPSDTGKSTTQPGILLLIDISVAEIRASVT